MLTARKLINDTVQTLGSTAAAVAGRVSGRGGEPREAAEKAATRRQAATKAAATRKQAAARRSETARKAAATRKANAQQRSASAKRAARTRTQRDERVEAMVDATRE